MLRSRRSLSKTEWTDTFAYCADASELFSFSSGAVLFQLSLPGSIANGVYSLCDSEKYFPDYLLFAVNQGAHFVNYPGIYAAFSPNGIVFTIWTRYGRFSILDDQSDISANTSTIIEFCWNSSGQVLGCDATMAIFINEECTAAGNFLIGDDSVSNLNFFAFDSKDVEFNLTCSIEDFACFSQIPPSRIGEVASLTHHRFSDDQIVLTGRSGSQLYVDGISSGGSKITSIKCFGASHHSVDVCDLTGDIFFCSFYDDDYSSGYVGKFDMTRSKVVSKLRSLSSPRSISVIQREGIGFPRAIYYDDTTCYGTWIAAADSVVRTDSNLIQQVEMTGFSSPSCIRCLNDNTCWVSDTGNNLVKHVSYDAATLLHSVAISSPTHLVTNTSNEVYVYSSSSRTLSLIRNGAFVKNISLGPRVVDVEINPNTGRILVAYSDGYLKLYDRFLKLETTARPVSHIDSICVRRGYHQYGVVIVDVLGSSVILTKIGDLGTVYASREFDDSIYFNDGLCATARNVGITADVAGDFSLDFTVGLGAVIDVQENVFKVDKHDVDLTDGGEKGAYLKLRGISPGSVPTDEPEGIVKSADF